jgi:hypothetical protein
MSSRVRSSLGVFCALVILTFLLSPGRVLSEDVQSVLVTNFPALQKVEGTVTVEGIVRHGTPRRYAEITVSPAKPSETRRLTPGGTLETDGYTSMVLGLSGQFKTSLPRPGDVGAILLPDEEAVLRAFYEDGKFQFTHEFKALAESGISPYFASEQVSFTIGFPRYRIFFYNTTDRTVGVNLYVYLTN